MDVPFNILVLFVGIAFTIGIIGIILGLRKINGSPFIVIIAGMIMFSYIAIIDKVEVDYVEDVNYTLEYPMNVTTSNSNTAFSTTTFGIAERVVNTNSVLYDKPISCIIIDLSKTLNPTGTVIIGVFDSSNMVIKQFGSIPASSISTTQRAYTYCLPNHDYYVLSLYDYVGAMHTTSTGTDFVKVHNNNVDNFDGTNSVKSAFTTVWTDVTAHDLRMKLISGDANIVGEPVLYDLNDNDIYVFMIFFSAFFIFIGVMIMRQLK